MTERSRMRPEPWLIHFFRRDARDDKSRVVPAIEFLDQVPTKVRAEIQAVLEAVAEAPPPAFSGGGKWEAMHDDMAASTRFASVARTAATIGCSASSEGTPPTSGGGGSSIVVIDGL